MRKIKSIQKMHYVKTNVADELWWNVLSIKIDSNQISEDSDEILKEINYAKYLSNRLIK